MFQYLNLSAHFRGQNFNAVVKLDQDATLSKDEVVDIICKKLKATIPASEISSNTSLSDESTWNTSAGDYKYDLTEKKELDTATVEGEDYD